MAIRKENLKCDVEIKGGLEPNLISPFTRKISLQKPFDSKLLQNNSNGQLYQLISVIYSNNKCAIKCGTQRISYFKYDIGIRRGCILAHLLFNVYLDNLPRIINSSDGRNYRTLIPNQHRESLLIIIHFI